MKSIVVFYDDKSKFGNEKVFGGKSAVELSGEWAKALGTECFTVEACVNLTELLEKLCEISAETKADAIVYSFNDLPFLNLELTKKILKAHEEYKCEYTFADGYSYGFSPEVIDCGTLRILKELSKTNGKSEGEKPVIPESIFNLIKTDINSFEVESVISDNDYRLFRYKFNCSKKENFIACKELFELCGNKEKLFENDVEEISVKATKTETILKTVPGFYNIQISDKTLADYIYTPYNKEYEKLHGINPVKAENFMKFEDFSKLMDKIAAFSDSGVVSLSAWGEPLCHPDFLKFVEKVLSYSGFSVFVETDGTLVSDELCNKLAEITKGTEQNVITKGTEQSVIKGLEYPRIMFAVTLDSFTAETYNAMHKVNQGFEKTVEAISKLNAVIPGCVYPQFTRMNQNESELEKFYRYWNEKSNASGGNLIIQKYDDFCGMLPACKPADLAPLGRNVCWHLRRDMTILTDGSVPVCREMVFDGSVGNAFTEDLEEIWSKFNKVLREHLQCNYNEKCKNCDEWYTYNF